MALIRYPGSKEKLVKQIMERFPMQFTYPEQLFTYDSTLGYVEPFFGAGAIGLLVMREINPKLPVWINDIDPGMVALWRSVAEFPNELCSMIYQFKPSAENFYRFKREDGREDLTDLDRGFRKLALHRMSFSGLGYMSGGPLGGKIQDNAKYPVDCRWRPERMKKEIRDLNLRMKRFASLRITNLDFEEVLAAADESVFVYLDPPYYHKGGQLYKHNMSPDDHRRLAVILQSAPFSWALSYDDCPEIRSLYSWATIEPVFITYTTGHSKISDQTRPKNQEILIAPERIAA